MKRIILIIFAASMLLFSCKGKNNAENNSAQYSQSAQNTESSSSASEISSVNPELEKLGAVLSSMSERCKATIPNGSPEEFLLDLHAVLEAEKSFPADDLSLYHLIDKKHFVSSDYEPKNLMTLVKNDLYAINRNNLSLRSDAEAALRVMAADAKADGITLLVSSTYRSYQYQETVFARWVEIDGLEEAERESSRPGTSQHQLGAVIDFGSISDEFADTAAGKWLDENAYKYGWSLSFPQGYEDVTGYRWECWHFRYIGKTACQFQRKWFSDVQQFMIEFIDAWKNYGL